MSFRHGQNKETNMITEDYVSFETAKLLEEKGFNWDCESKRFYPEPDYDQESPNGVYAPTLQMAMKWLREEHNLFIEIWYNTEPEHMYCDAGIYGLGNERKKKIKDLSSYEEAAEAAIKYCLEKLI